MNFIISMEKEKGDKKINVEKSCISEGARLTLIKT